VSQSVFDDLLRRALERLSLQLKGGATSIDELLFKWRLQKAAVPDAASIPTWTSKRELRVLYDLAVSLPPEAIALEIGSYLGASTCYIAAGLAQNGGHLFCVDTWANETMPEGFRNTFAEFEANIQGVRAYVTPVRKKSSELVRSDIQEPLNFVFIDGDHSYTAVRNDFELIQPWLAQDSIVAFHDANNPDYEGVSRLIGDVLASNDWSIVGVRDRLVWIKCIRSSKPLKHTTEKLSQVEI
jgi:predicted O-methyltransferase YrrM